jgi:hypothetical protein
MRIYWCLENEETALKFCHLCYEIKCLSLYVHGNFECKLTEVTQGLWTTFIVLGTYSTRHFGNGLCFFFRYRLYEEIATLLGLWAEPVFITISS